MLTVSKSGLTSNILVVSILVAAMYLLVSVTSDDPAAGLYFLLVYPLIDPQGIVETLIKTTPILLASLGCFVTFRAGIWNIGAEGQLYLGAMAAAWTGILTMPPGLHILAVMASSFAAGGAYALLPAILKVKREINEVLTTIMLNYIALWLAHYTIHWPPLRDPQAANPQTIEIAATAKLPLLLPQSRLHAGVVIVAIASIATFFLVQRSKLGYEIRVTGSNPSAAIYGGINVKRIIIISMFISGGLAGLAGMGEVAGLHYYLLDNISPGYGYVAVLVALLGGRSVLGVVLAALLAGVVYNGADIMQIMLATPKEIADIVVSLTMLLMISRAFIAKKALGRVIK